MLNNRYDNALKKKKRTLRAVRFAYASVSTRQNNHVLYRGKPNTTISQTSGLLRTWLRCSSRVTRCYLTSVALQMSRAGDNSPPECVRADASRRAASFPAYRTRRICRYSRRPTRINIPHQKLSIILRLDNYSQ